MLTWTLAPALTLILMTLAPTVTVTLPLTLPLPDFSPSPAVAFSSHLSVPCSSLVSTYLTLTRALTSQAP